ncbi:MAG TPA: peptide deformylase [Candidatus Scatovivens faecipullorum]|nr:peptide deformylase [Candidatus Scatovivens faecipullorum]
MAIRNLRYENDEILKKRAKEIDIIDEKIRELAEDMMETMHKWDGVGLAGPQVGVLKRIIVIDLYEEGTQFILINPVIIKEKGVQEVDEGCLSFPNKFGKVDRPKEVVVEALDIDGKKVKLKAKDFLAQVLSHEIDHLNGIVFTEKVKPGTLEIITPNEKK